MWAGFSLHHVRILLTASESGRGSKDAFRVCCLADIEARMEDSQDVWIAKGLRASISFDGSTSSL